MPKLQLTQRIVHLDLKGAPLKVAYLEKLVTTIKQWGVTGILLEWEDTFPYSGGLEEIGSVNNAGGDNMYSFAEVQHIIQFITNNEMVPIQLVQTIGHMEFVLKHRTFHELQELPRSPAVLCPSKTKSKMLVREMINQTLAVQPDAKFFHIGGDEVWHTGVCGQCIENAANHPHKASSLYLDHIKGLVTYIRESRPDIIVLMWDDMLRTIDLQTLKAYNLGESVIPVVWNYNSEISFTIDEGLMERYSVLFPRLWFGSAFKGANGSCEILSPSERYVSNHVAWVAQVHANSWRVYFSGAILTGWSRYDHYATLCELLPVALPSLAACMRVLTEEEGRPLDVILSQPSEVLPSSEWPGEQVGRCVHTFTFARERCLALLSSDIVNTWMNPWQMSRRYTTPTHVGGIAVVAEHTLVELQVIKSDMITYLQEITGPRSTEEWIMSYIDPLITKITRLGERALQISHTGASVRPVAPH